MVLRQYGLYLRGAWNIKKLYVSYVDYEKAFDRVNCGKMTEILRNIGVD